MHRPPEGLLLLMLMQLLLPLLPLPPPLPPLLLCVSLYLLAVLHRQPVIPPAG